MDTPKFKYPMNLQLFALNANGVEESDAADNDQDADEEEIELDDGNQEHEFEDDADPDDADSEDQEADQTDEADADAEPDDETNQKGNKNKGNNSTAAAVIAERKKWQAKLELANNQAGLADKIMKLSGATSVEDMQRRIDEVEANNLAAQSGVTTEQARNQIAERRDIADMKKQIQDQKYEFEFQNLKKDPFFADIESYKDEYQEIASRTGLTLEEVYLSKRGRERMKERETEIASRVNANKDKRQSKKVNTSSSGGGAGSQSSAKKLNLTPEQRQAAEYGVKKGYFKSIEEYAKYQ